jgi:hypothetical protein
MGFNIHILSGRNRSTNLARPAALAASFNPNQRYECPQTLVSAKSLKGLRKYPDHRVRPKCSIDSPARLSTACQPMIFVAVILNAALRANFSVSVFQLENVLTELTLNARSLGFSRAIVRVSADRKDRVFLLSQLLGFDLQALQVTRP